MMIRLSSEDLILYTKCAGVIFFSILTLSSACKPTPQEEYSIEGQKYHRLIPLIVNTHECGRGFGSSRNSVARYDVDPTTGPELGAPLQGT
jgi:hypothetical protein